MRLEAAHNIYEVRRFAGYMYFGVILYPCGMTGNLATFVYNRTNGTLPY